MHQAACLARSAARLVAWVSIETGTMPSNPVELRRVEGHDTHDAGSAGDPLGKTCGHREVVRPAAGCARDGEMLDAELVRDLGNFRDPAPRPVGRDGGWNRRSRAGRGIDGRARVVLPQCPDGPDGRPAITRNGGPGLRRPARRAGPARRSSYGAPCRPRAPAPSPTRAPARAASRPPCRGRRAAARVPCH